MKFENKNFLFIAIIILMIIPIWLIPIAPIGDWLIHLTISKESYLILSGQVENPYYFVDTTFLGYSIVYILLIALQNFVSIGLAGQIVLTLLIVITPICWRRAFEILDPAKKNWFLIGSIFNYSWFFYLGTINYLFSIPFGIAFFANGIDAIKNNKDRAIELLLFAILTYLSHGFIFLFLSIILFSLAFYKRVYKQKKIHLKTIIVLTIIFILAIYNTATNQSINRDSTYSINVESCVNKLMKMQYFELNMKTELLANYMRWIADGLFKSPWLRTFSTLFASFYLALITLIMMVSIFIVKTIKSIIEKKPLEREFEFIKKMDIKLDKFYFSIALILLLLTLIIPIRFDKVSGFSTRIVPFAFAFFIFSINLKKHKEVIRNLILAVIIINSIYLGYLFYEQNNSQNMLREKYDELANQIPAGSKVLILPAEYEKIGKDYLSGKNAGYHALVLFYNPQIYLSGLFLYQDTFFLRKNVSVYDSLSEMGLGDKYIENVTKCYYPIPDIYDYYIDERLILHKN